MLNKRGLVFIIALCVVVFSLFAATPEFLNSFNINKSNVFQVKNAEGEYLSYLIIDENSVSLIGGKDKPKARVSKYGSRTLTVPSSVEYNGKVFTVKYIQSFAFRGEAVNDTNIKKIEKIILPNTLEIVGQSCFEGMPSLKSVNIPKSLKIIEYCMFADCPALEEVHIPNDAELECIASFAFENCPSLKYVNIPAGVKSIGEGPWRECTSLVGINVTSMNENFMSKDGVLLTKRGTEIIQYPAGKTDETYIFPSGVTSVGNSAFFGNNFIKKIVMSDSMQYISHIAFNGCQNLSDVYFPNSLISIGNGAFQNCPNLKGVTIPQNTHITKNQSYEDDPYNTFMPNVVIERATWIPQQIRNHIKSELHKNGA